MKLAKRCLAAAAVFVLVGALAAPIAAEPVERQPQRSTILILASDLFESVVRFVQRIGPSMTPDGSMVPPPDGEPSPPPPQDTPEDEPSA